MEEKEYFDKLTQLGIDKEVGISYSGDEELYREILGISCKGSVEKIERLVKVFENKDYESYKILVHSVKSSALNIGAISISEMAKQLEDAGMNHDYKYIDDNHKEFLLAYQTLMVNLGDIIFAEKELIESNRDNITYTGELSSEQLNDNVKILMQHLEELELDEAELLAKDMLLYNINSNSRNILIELVECLEHFDVEGSKGRIGQLML